MPINVVQSQSDGVRILAPHNSTHLQQVSIAFGLNVTAGNTIIVAVGCPSSTNSITATFPSVTDSLGNTYTQATWANSASQIAGIGIFWFKIPSGGADTVTFSVFITNFNPIFDLNYDLGIAVVEMSGMGASPALHAANTAQQGPGTLPLAITLTDQYGTSVTSNFGSFSQTSCAVADIAAVGADVFVAALCGSTVSPTTPSVSPPGYMTYNLQENAVFGGSNYPIALWVRNTPILPGVIPLPQFFIVT